MSMEKFNAPVKMKQCHLIKSYHGGKYCIDLQQEMF
jgi:hypothetical protein